MTLTKLSKIFKASLIFMSLCFAASVQAEVMNLEQSTKYERGPKAPPINDDGPGEV